jgi:hypothetical protein
MLNNFEKKIRKKKKKSCPYNHQHFTNKSTL